MGIMILDRRIKATPSDLIPLLKQALQSAGWDMHNSGKNQEGIISFSIFGRFPDETSTLLPALGWVTFTGVQGETQVRIHDQGLNTQDSDIQKYLDEQPYDVTEMFIDIAAFLIRTVEGGKAADDWLIQMRQTAFDLYHPKSVGGVEKFWERLGTYAEDKNKYSLYHFTTTEERLNHGGAHISFGINGDAGSIRVSTDPNGLIHLKAKMIKNYIILLAQEWDSLYQWLIQDGWLPEGEMNVGQSKPTEFQEHRKIYNRSRDRLYETVKNLYLQDQWVKGYLLKPPGVFSRLDKPDESGYLQLEFYNAKHLEDKGRILFGKIDDEVSTLVLRSDNPDAFQFFEKLTAIVSKFVPQIPLTEPDNKKQPEYEIVGHIDAKTTTFADVANTLKRVTDWISKPSDKENAEQVGAMVLPKIEDPTDQRIWEYIQKDPSITDFALAQKLGNMTRQAVNTRRRALEKMGYQVRRMSRQKK